MFKSGDELQDRTRPFPGPVDESEAWAFVCRLRSGGGRSSSGRICLSFPGIGDALWSAPSGATPEAERLLHLCVPLCTGARSANLVVAHLGQSLDGRVAVPPGLPRLITGAEDLRHTHRLRALCDAIVVGASTVAIDDPQLTTRLVPGDHPTRVVLDPRARLPRDRRVFTDGQSACVVVVGRDHASSYADLRGVDVVPLPLEGGKLAVADVLGALRARRLRRIFVEGGGVTVSRFLEAGAIDRLHVAVASRILGTGAPALQLGGGRLAATVANAKSYLLDTDVLFDCDVGAAAAAGRGLA